MCRCPAKTFCVRPHLCSYLLPTHSPTSACVKLPRAGRSKFCWTVSKCLPQHLYRLLALDFEQLVHAVDFAIGRFMISEEGRRVGEELIG